MAHKLETRITLLEQRSQQAIRCIPPCTAEEAQAAYDSMVNAAPEYILDMPTDQNEAARIYVQFVRGEIDFPLKENHGA